MTEYLTVSLSVCLSCLTRFFYGYLLQGEAPAIRRACQFGVSTATFDVADWMLSFADPPLEE